MLVELLVVCLAVGLHGVLVGGEVAVASCKRSLLKELATRRPRAMEAVASLKEAPGALAIVVKAGTTLLSTAAGALGAAMLTQGLTPVLHHF